MSNKKVKVLNPSLMVDSPDLDTLRATLGGTFQTGIKGGYKYVKSENQDAELYLISDVEEIDSMGTGHSKIFKQTITIQQSTKVTESPGGDTQEGDDLWNAYVTTRAQPLMISSTDPHSGNYYYDDYAIFFSKMTTEEVLSMDADFPEADAGVEYTYNFLDASYEKELKTVTKHTIIPNLYNMAEEAMQVEDSGINILNDSNQTRKLLRNKRASMGPVDEREQYKNQLVPSENNEFLSIYHANAMLFPMFARINIPMHAGGLISQAIGYSQLGCCIMRDLFGAPPEGIMADSIGYEDMLYSMTYFDTAGNRIVDPISTPAQTVDLGRWLDEDAPSWGSADIPNDWMHLGPESVSEKVASGPGYEANAAMGIDYLKGHLLSLWEDNVRTYQDLLDGEEAYSETVIYKVTKFLGDGIDQEIQSFYFMNSMELDDFMETERLFSLVDTQVKYNETYTYAITAYEAIIGSKYVYRNINIQAPDKNQGFEDRRWATIDVQTYPYLKIIEVPLFMSIGKILDNPPLEPEISFIPLKNHPNHLTFFLNTNTGQFDTEPIALTDEEAEDASQIMFNQRRVDGKITFGTDDHNVAYRIYRTTEPPLGYGDFTDKLLAIASTTPNTSGDYLTAGSVSVKLSQTPNKKFYYMFRSVDFHGGLSNPSTVYEIELYNDGGVGYPIIKEYVFDSMDPKTTTKSARKLIQIVPKITQAYLNEAASGLVNTDGSVSSAIRNMGIVLGVEDEPLFGKKFKIRLTSRKTGKKLDINVDFTTKRVLSSIE